ncbi:LuxR C-terminal-related transcriptional regulator [Haloglycomyces albus]|uniref:LuxR C-terminal-related transcriptional regulator n=1 Tax=Haloglycomyces albus TaxID=526067 RepID=UPI00046D1DA2|nr:LuxR C-terminal-related transcriptional regulator [Haloglycomyces albus]
MLESLGIDKNIESVYVALLQNPGASVRVLAESVGIDESESTEAVNVLTGLSLVAPRADGGYAAIDPEVGLSSLLTDQSHELLQRQREIEQTRLGVATLLANIGGAGHGRDSDTERVIGREAIGRRLRELEQSCVEEMLSFNPQSSIPPEHIEESRPLFEDSLERGVRTRMVFLESIRRDRPSVEYLDWIGAEGGLVRVTPSLPVRLLIVDRSVAFVPISDRHCSGGALVVKGETLVTAMVALFHDVWRSAVPLGRKRKRDDNDLSDQERHVLQMWSRGLTDDAVARQLHVSPRTVRRISADLLERLGAQSRFQAGALAIARGWLLAHDLV